MTPNTAWSRPLGGRAASLTSFLLAALALGAATPAQATGRYLLRDDTSETQISGKRDGLRRPNLGRANSYHAIWEISLWEKGDDACKIAAKSRHLNTLGTATSRDELKSSCNNDKKTVSFPDTNTYVRGVQVCLSSSGKIKGLRLYGTRLNHSTGRLSDLRNPKEFTRPNCRNNWKNTVYCPPEKIAWMVRPYKTGSNFNGLQLLCRTVAPQPTHP